MMTLVNNDYTLLPHNGWSTGQAVRGSRKWQTGVGTGIRGNEQRAALRAVPLYKLSYTIIPTDLGERARLDARIDQAEKSGMAAIPFLGRAMYLAQTANAGNDTITLSAANNWTWQPGDWVFLFQDDLTFDAVEVAEVAGLTLTLAGNLEFTWNWPGIVWPLLFGQFTSQKQTAISGHLGGWSITVEEMVSGRNAQLGAVAPPAGTGIGVDQVGISNPIT